MLGWLVKRMTNVSPNNPIWQRELRQYHGQIQQLRRRAGRILPIIALICFLMVVVDSSTEFQTNSATYLWFNLSFIISVLIMLPVDFVYAQAALSSLNQYRPYGDWDLVALTKVRPAQVLEAKFAAALVRSWRGLMFELVLRVVTAVTLISVYVIGNLLGLFRSETDEFLGWVMLLSVMAIGYLAEPFWRMRTLTAFGIALSAARVDQTQTTALTVGAVIGLRLLQLAYFLLVVTLFNWYSSFGSRYFFGGDSLSIAFSISLMVGAAWLGSYLIYMIFQRTALRFAERRIFKAEI